VLVACWHYRGCVGAASLLTAYERAADVADQRTGTRLAGHPAAIQTPLASSPSSPRATTVIRPSHLLYGELCGAQAPSSRSGCGRSAAGHRARIAHTGVAPTGRCVGPGDRGADEGGRARRRFTSSGRSEPIIINCGLAYHSLGSGSRLTSLRRDGCRPAGRAVVQARLWLSSDCVSPCISPAATPALSLETQLFHAAASPVGTATVTVPVRR